MKSPKVGCAKLFYFVHIHKDVGLQIGLDSILDHALQAAKGKRGRSYGELCRPQGFRAARDKPEVVHQLIQGYVLRRTGRVSEVDDQDVVSH